LHKKQLKQKKHFKQFEHKKQLKHFKQKKHFKRKKQDCLNHDLPDFRIEGFYNQVNPLIL